MHIGVRLDRIAVDRGAAARVCGLIPSFAGARGCLGSGDRAATNALIAIETIVTGYWETALLRSYNQHAVVTNHDERNHVYTGKASGT